MFNNRRIDTPTGRVFRVNLFRFQVNYQPNEINGGSSFERNIPQTERLKI